MSPFESLAPLLSLYGHLDHPSDFFHNAIHRRNSSGSRAMLQGRGISGWSTFYILRLLFVPQLVEMIFLNATGTGCLFNNHSLPVFSTDWESDQNPSVWSSVDQWFQRKLPGFLKFLVQLRLLLVSLAPTLQRWCPDPPKIPKISHWNQVASG